MYLPDVVCDSADLQSHLAYFQSTKAFSFDLEATGSHRGDAMRAEPAWISLATTGRAITIPLWQHPGLTNFLDPELARKLLWDLFMSDHVKIAQNAAYDLTVMSRWFDKRVPGPIHDTLVMRWLVDENAQGKMGLKDQVASVYGIRYDTKGTGKDIAQFPAPHVADYSRADALYTWLLHAHWHEILHRQSLTPIMGLEHDLIPVLRDMRLEGAPIDVEHLRQLRETFSQRCDVIEKKAHQIAGKEFNLRSPKQKAALLYSPQKKGGRGLKIAKFTRTGQPSTDADALAVHASDPLVSVLIDYAEASKILTTYIDGYLGTAKKASAIHEGRIHADFRSWGTKTGRFSCAAPNLQQIPRPDSEDGKLIRGLFIAPAGFKLVVADWGQAEMVILAHYAGPGPLQTAFHSGIDPHTMTAALIFGRKPEEVSKAERQCAKAVNFAIAYGAGPSRVANMAHISLTQAGKVLAKHRREFPEVYRFRDDLLHKARTRRPPFIKTLLGRKRRLPELHASDKGIRALAERRCVNSLIQGSQADLMKLAMIRAHQRLSDIDGAALILTVHDELVALCPDTHVAATEEAIRDAMLGDGIQQHLTVPIGADIKAVDRWADAK